ncbi:FHA domain-containing protein FhaB/FipA [Actinorugispora endophytica]|uniref:FHA domain-containing protein n=1 Tax=Actinorugispora endophytica TaxID=1605990 RepID=A0A4R6V109_9ACTN|nr:FHA domain-containing protein [Actinorugispora endophytica]TDQ52315.1 FHA domain-containing protein [Actinorugispora endophytica]
MSDLTLMLIKLAFLAVLWLFIIMAVGVIRTDLFGPATSKAKRGAARRSEPRRPKPAPQRGRRNEPRSLVVTKGPLAGTTLDLSSQPIIIGRAKDATLVITDDYASGRHARIFSDNGRWVVEDLGSTNGTYLGQNRLTRPQPLSVGQPIRIGKTVLELRK